MSKASQPNSCLSSTAIPITLEPTTAQVPSTATPVSAWKSLLPGVAPTPSPVPPTAPAAIKSSRPPRSVNNNYKSHDLRLNEILPIVLPPEREAKLSMEMIDLFESLLPTEESHKRRTRLIKKIEDILHLEWPGQDIKAEPFGSTVNGLGTSTSDVDLCITTTWPGLKNVQMLATAFRKHGMQKVFCVAGAKVPIVKLWDPELHLSCDMNINTPLGLMNTRMIKTYVAIDPRVRPFAMIIKHWARKRVLNDAANGGTISTYTWICIVINFLQMRSPPILPALHDMPHTLSADNQVINGNNTSFCEDLSKLEGFGYANKETLGGLLYAFFRRFAIEFDYDHHVISVRHGCYLTKESKDWHIPGKHYKLFCVEEPLDTSRNLGNSSDMASSKGLKQEFGRALDILIHRGSLNECCEQWVFPPIFYNNNFRSGENNGYNHTRHAAGRRYTLGYRQSNNPNLNNTFNQYKEQSEIVDDDEEESAHYAGDRSYASFRSMVTTTSMGQNGYRTNRSNSVPKLDVSAFSGYRNSSAKPATPFTGANIGTSSKSSAVRSPPSKNGMASSFSGNSYLDQDPFGVPFHHSSATRSRNRSKSVSAVENNIIAIRPPIKQEKSSGGANTANVNGSGTGAPRQRRSKSSNRSDGSKQVGNNNYNSSGANHHSHNQQHQQHLNQHHNQNQNQSYNNSTSGGNGGNGNGNKQGRSNTNHNHNSNAPTNGSGRSPRSTVEFSLADIAPKAMMSSANMSSKDLESQKSGSDGKKGGSKRNVVWSTNSNRGESRGTHSGAHGNNSSNNNIQKGPQMETEKKVKATKALAEHPEQAGPREVSA